MLPSINVANLAEAVKEAKFEPSSTGGDSIFCKFDYQTGDYLLGRELIDIKGEEVVVHTDSIAVGWICWSGGKATKNLVSFTEGLPPQPAPIGNDNYSEARAIMFKTTEGEQAILEGNSYGIRSGIDALIKAIKNRALDPANANYLYPRVTLSSNSYKHSQGNTIYNTQFDVVGWCNANGELQGDTAIADSSGKSDADEEAVAKPVRRRGRG